MIYAHIDRERNNGINYLNTYPLSGVELSFHANEDFIKKHQLEHAKVLRSSDAHQLTDILEKTSLNQIELNELTIESFFSFFNHG
jgi:hypothetical protein